MKQNTTGTIQQSGAKKDEGNNQWTNAHLKSKKDKRKRQDGPGGN